MKTDSSWQSAVGSRPVPSLLLAVGVALLTFVVYALTVAPDMLPGDSGEFQFAVPLLSIVHPTGYPLYLILAKIFSFIPIGSVAYRVNLFSAVCAALAVGAMYLAALTVIENWGSGTRDERWSCIVRQTSAIAAALTLAFTPTFWAQAREAEVYALNSLFVIVLIGFGIWVRREHKSQTCPERSRRVANRKSQIAWLWFALVLGLSLAHHRSIILLLPALAIYLFPFKGLRLVWRRAAFLCLAPLALYLYTPLRYDATPYTQIRLDDTHVITTLANTPQAFVAHALGTGFGGALRWDERAVGRLLATPERLPAEFTLIGTMLIRVSMLWILWRRRWRLFALVLVTYVCYIIFNAAYQIGDIADYYTPIYIVGALLVGLSIIGLDEFLQWAGDHLRARATGQSPPMVIRAVALVALVVPAWLLATQFAAMRQHDATRAHWQQLLTPDVPQGAILISNDRDELTPLYYLQLVENTRPDLLPLFPLISPNLPHVVPLTEYALETSRPVYFIKPMDGLSVKFRVQPQGALGHVLGLQATRPDHTLVRDSSSLMFSGWSQIANLHPEPAEGRNSQIEVVLFWQARGAARPDVKTYVHVLDRDGRLIAQSDHVPGGDYYPPSQWAAGESLYDSHVIPLPSDTPRGALQLVAGAYRPDGGALEGVGRMELEAVKLGE